MKRVYIVILLILAGCGDQDQPGESRTPHRYKSQWVLVTSNGVYRVWDKACDYVSIYDFPSREDACQFVRKMNELEKEDLKRLAVKEALEKREALTKTWKQVTPCQ